MKGRKFIVQQGGLANAQVTPGHCFTSLYRVSTPSRTGECQCSGILFRNHKTKTNKMEKTPQPHYEHAPITGKNLKALMLDYFPDYHLHSIQSEYDTLCGALNVYLVKHKELDHHDITMDDVEQYCIKTQPHLDTAFKSFKGQDAKSSYPHCALLDIILHANLLQWHSESSKEARNVIRSLSFILFQNV